MTQSSPKTEYVTDTISLVLAIERRRSGEHAKTIFAAAAIDEVTIHVPTMVLAEVLYLSERNRISASLADAFVLIQESNGFRERPMSLRCISAAAEITDIPELHDRLIAGAARSLRLPLITNDRQIAASAYITTIW